MTYLSTYIQFSHGKKFTSKISFCLGLKSRSVIFYVVLATALPCCPVSKSFMLKLTHSHMDSHINHLFFPTENHPFVKAVCSKWSSPTGLHSTVLLFCLSHMRLIHAQSQYKVHILPSSFLSLTINLSLFHLLFSLYSADRIYGFTQQINEEPNHAP